ncbi:unnamed protein product [Peronospora destructor]|uniref:EF-hand domain-containing protein n=1 Tax=Peronospora destructor TaxID=86335 RepID=A0AAV0UH22_9STRA|nr:unnamed protein product [Peronospora destructor]
MRQRRLHLRLMAGRRGLMLVLTLFTLLYGNILCLANRMKVILPSTTFRIDSKTQMKDIFKCSGLHFIGSFNEYYVNCELFVPAQEQLQLLEIVNVTLDGSKLSPLPGVHAELTFNLNTSLTTVSIHNSQLHASAVEIHAANVFMDNNSVVNVTARGLKFGPGYNSWSLMGGSYGGIGGASLTDRYSNCDDVSRNDFFRAVGDVSANSTNFRGYGSGGGNDKSRGGGRISVVVEGNVEIHGFLLANGGDACENCYDSAGAGGSIVVVATERIYGNGTVQANGGEPSIFSNDEFTGGGGEKDDGGRNGSQRLRNSKIVVSTLLVKGGRLAHSGPVKRIQIYGCTPIFQQTPRGARFLPESLAHMFVNGGATVCASVIELQDSVGGIESSIVVDSGSQLNVLDRERAVRLSASQISLQGYVGPSSLQERDLFGLLLIGADVSFSNALAMVHELDVDARGALSIDEFSLLKFQTKVNIKTNASTKICGFLQPLGKPSEQVHGSNRDDVPLISVISNKDVEFCPQTVEMGQVGSAHQGKWHTSPGYAVRLAVP